MLVLFCNDSWTVPEFVTSTAVLPSESRPSLWRGSSRLSCRQSIMAGVVTTEADSSIATNGRRGRI